MKTQLLTTLGNVKNYTLSVAEAMPESHYDFKPVATVWDFGELIQHIGYGIGWWEENYIRQQPADWNPPAAKTGKAAAVTYLKKAFASLEKSIEKAQLSDNVTTGFYSTIDHITHHRGQATIYLRMNGITPPEYVY